MARANKRLEIVVPITLAIGPLSEAWSFLTFDFTALNSSLRAILASEPGAPIPQVACIMGMDFLSAHRAIIDVRQQRLYLHAGLATPDSSAPLPLHGPHRRFPAPR